MKNNNPKYAFYYLLSLVSLIFLAVSSAIIVFQIINKSVIDNLSNYFYYSGDSSLRFGISAILIALPIFFLSARTIERGLKRGDLDKDSSLRKWLTYFILFISSIIILGSLLSLVNNFLSGELTLKFVLKFFTILIISFLVFSFYLYDIRREKIKKNDKIIKLFLISSLSLISVIFISSWFFVESPKTARDRRMDDALLNNIYNIEANINSYYESNGLLPDNLDILGEDFYLKFNNIISKIEYKKTDEKSFELCANFLTDSYESIRNESYPIYKNDGSKYYVKGYNCFNGNLWVEIKK